MNLVVLLHWHLASQGSAFGGCLVFLNTEDLYGFESEVFFLIMIPPWVLVAILLVWLTALGSSLRRGISFRSSTSSTTSSPFPSMLLLEQFSIPSASHYLCGLVSWWINRFIWLSLKQNCILFWPSPARSNHVVSDNGLVDTSISFTESLIFGSLISAVDPVAVGGQGILWWLGDNCLLETLICTWTLPSGVGGPWGSTCQWNA